MDKVAIIIPTWNNLQFLVQCIRSVKERTDYDGYRIICVPNGCNDGTVQWLQKNQVEFFELGPRSGFVKSTNVGMDHVEPDEHVLLLNDDTRITDRNWLKNLVSVFDDPTVGAVGPASNFILGTQDFRLDTLPPIHETPFLIGLCMLIRNEAFKAVGKLDEAYGVGTNEDLDYSLALRDKGYKLMVNRDVFVFHYGSRSLLRVAKDANLDSIQFPTRETFKQKWGEERCNTMLNEMKEIVSLARAGWGA